MLPLLFSIVVAPFNETSRTASEVDIPSSSVTAAYFFFRPSLFIRGLCSLSLLGAGGSAFLS
jgi:hypothetical protein